MIWATRVCLRPSGDRGIVSASLCWRGGASVVDVSAYSFPQLMPDLDFFPDVSI